ncbi:MAG: site-specific integrase [Chloroflexi bacterium]|nr:site-specific integrase [Chloroflexota bacterium]
MTESTARRTRRRSAGEGSVYRQGTRWRGAVTWTEPDGTRSRRIVSAPTAAEARDKLDVLRRELRLGTLAPAGPASTVVDFLTAWIERDRSRVRPSTWRQREMHVRCYLIPALGRLALARLSAADVERAIGGFMANGRPAIAEDRKHGQRHAPVSPLTARHVRATLRRALGDAARDGLVGRNAAADARPPYVAHRPVTYLAAPDVRRLLDATADAAHGPLYALAATTGLRLGELLGLTWPDVANGTLTVRRSLARAAGRGWELAQPKSARSRRSIPLPATAREALDRQRVRQDAARVAAGSAWQDRDGLVFTDAVGRHLSPDSVSVAFGQARDAAGIPRVPFRDLRHSAATMMLAEGVPLAVISEWLGHAGIAITASHYAAVVPALRHEAAAAMDRALTTVDRPQEIRP